MKSDSMSPPFPSPQEAISDDPEPPSLSHLQHTTTPPGWVDSHVWLSMLGDKPSHPGDLKLPVRKPGLWGCGDKRCTSAWEVFFLSCGFIWIISNAAVSAVHHLVELSACRGEEGVFSVTAKNYLLAVNDALQKKAYCARNRRLPCEYIYTPLLRMCRVVHLAH